MVTPTLAALDDEAPLTEWTLKIDVLMPDSSSRDLSQQATVLGETGWFGFVCQQQSGFFPMQFLCPRLVGFLELSLDLK